MGGSSGSMHQLPLSSISSIITHLVELSVVFAEYSN